MIMYLIIILFSMVAVVLFNWLALGWSFFCALSWVAIAVGIEIVIIVILTIIAGLCVPKRLYRECKLYDVGKKELNFYRFIYLSKWKDYVCELGMLSGFSKKKVVDPTNINYINRFITELNKGMFVHMVCTLGSFFILFAPIPGRFFITVPVALVGAILNILPIMVLRYNKPRLLMLKTRLTRNVTKNVVQPTTTQR